MSITKERILDSYKKTGLIPVRKVFYKKGCGCALTTLLVEIYGEAVIAKMTGSQIRDLGCKMFGYSICNALMCGFDGHFRDDEDPETYQAASEAAKELFSGVAA